MKNLIAFLLMFCSVFVFCADTLKVKDSDRILIFGASNIWFGSYRPYGMAALFQSGLKTAGSKAIVFSTGHPGEGTVTFVNGRLAAALKQFKPTVLMITAGGNDVSLSNRHIKGYSPEVFEPNVNKLIDMAQAQGCRVILITGTCSQLGEKIVKQEKVNRDIMCKIAKQRKLDLIDLYSAVEQTLAKNPNQALHIDKIHFNGLGYQLFAIQLLRWTGVPEKTIQAEQTKWNDIPSMTLYLNTPHDPKDLVSVKDYQLIHDEAVKKGVTVEEYVRSLLRSHITELQKKK